MQQMNRIVRDMFVRWQYYRRRTIDMKEFAVACSQFSIAVSTVDYGTVCLFSDTACSRQLSVT